jgi:hypothetical protein
MLKKIVNYDPHGVEVDSRPTYANLKDKIEGRNGLRQRLENAVREVVSNQIV